MTSSRQMCKRKVTVFTLTLLVVMLLLTSRLYDEQLTNFVQPACNYAWNNVEHANTTWSGLSEIPDEIVITRVEQFMTKYCSRINISDSQHVTSGFLSKIVNVTRGEKSGEIHVAIQTVNQRNEIKDVGGDLIVIWAIQINGTNRIAGHVLDLDNGQHVGRLSIPWAGPTEIRVKVGAAVENTCRRLNAMGKYGNSVFSLNQGWGIRGVFKSTKMTESTPCGASSWIYDYSSLCDFTERNDNMSWFCGRPEHLNCSDIYSFGTGAIDASQAKESEKVILPSVYEFTDMIHTKVNGSRPEPTLLCKDRPPLDSWLETRNSTSGFWFNKQWRFINCYSNVQHTLNGYRKCISNKTLYLLGDSTVRQYASYIAFDVWNFPESDLKNDMGPKRTYHQYTMFEKDGGRLMYLKHALPFHNPDFPPDGITSYFTELHRLAYSDISDDGLVVMLNYHVHFQAYPVDIYRQRIAKSVLAIRDLLELKPRAKVLFKVPHFCVWDIRWYDHNLSKMYINILFEEFGDLMKKVIYLDVWSISLAFNNKDLHPEGDAFDSQIQQFMSYIC